MYAQDVKIGDKVRYVGDEWPECTGKVFEVTKIYSDGVILNTSEKILLEGSNKGWGLSFTAYFTDLEEPE